MTTAPDPSEVRRAVREKYGTVARSVEGRFAYPTGAEGARQLGYEEEEIAAAPAASLRSFCGVGNPHALGGLAPGERVLDVGCGAGFDLFVARRRVGAAGRVVGVDLTPEMVALANEVAETREATAEDLPFDDDSFDVVISNGVLNLSPRKERAFAELHRVLRRGGRLQLADIVLDGSLPEEVAGSLDAWSD